MNIFICIISLCIANIAYQYTQQAIFISGHEPDVIEALARTYWQAAAILIYAYFYQEKQ